MEMPLPIEQPQSNPERPQSLPESQELINPFPGLRPFSFRDKHLFFGRDGQSEKVLELLLRHRFAAVIGPSGSGKSSLINCGVIPELYGGYLYEAGSMWTIIRFNPGYKPIENLSEAIAETFSGYKGNPEKLNTESNLYYVLITKKSLGIGDLIKKSGSYKNENILIYIDQFEELFRFTPEVRKLEAGDEARIFINIFIDAIKQETYPIYVALSIRSDFLGSCVNYQTLTDYINQSHYLVPQMTRDAYKSAILGPLALSNVRINPDLLQEILNNTGEKTDQLPVLQHLMMRIWDYWKTKRDHNQPLSLFDYRFVGGIEDAISLHADEAYQELDDKLKKICKRMFQTITESGADNKGIRRPTTINDIARILKAKKEDVIKVADHFRKAKNSFITPDPIIPLIGESIIDISHEAVMRNWGKLKGWIEEESDAVQLYIRLAEASGLYQSGKIGPWKPPELMLAISWRDNFQPNDAWASQYNPAFNRSIKFLEISESAYNEEIAEKERMQKREINRTRWFAALIGVALVIAIGLLINSLALRKIADNARKDAEEQRKIAEMNALEADKQKNLALQYAGELEIQKAIVEGKWMNAEVERDDAYQTADAAVKKTTVTEKSLQEMSRGKEIAEESTREALVQKQRAEQEKAETFMQNMVLLAQNLSSKSDEIKDNNELKALLAYQAYKFNKQYNGPENQANIYSSIKGALNDLQVDYQVALNGHTESPRSLAVNIRDGSLFSAGSDGRLLKWKQFTDNAPSELIVKNNSINRIVVVSKNGKWVVCACEGTGIQVFDLTDQSNRERLFNAHENRVRSIALYNDNQHMLTSGIDNIVLKWDLVTGLNQTFYNLDSPAQTIAISGDDRYVAIGTKNGSLILYSGGSSAQPRLLLNEPNNQILSVAFTRKGNMLISGDQQGVLRIWTLDNNKLIYTRRLHQARIVDIRLDPSGKFIATCSTDGKVYLINTDAMNQTPVEVVSLSGFIFSIEFSNDGKTLFVASNNQSMITGYPVLADDLAKFICPNVSRNLTLSEWSYYMGEEVPFEKTCNK